jgi:hypothetical protein
MGGSSGLVDWRGRPVNTKKHGGVRASIFIHGKHVVHVCTNFHVAGVFLSLLHHSYL